MKLEHTHYMTGYICLTCGYGLDVDFHGYTCPACAGNLEVTYDYDRLRTELATGTLLDDSRRDIFRYAKLLPVAGLDKTPPLHVGGTPLHHAERLGAAFGLKNVYLKDDGLNPSGSFKDRASAVAITRARDIGATVLACASTGNAGSSTACMCAAVGMPAVIFVPQDAPKAKIAQLLVFGAHVMAVDGSYDDAFDLCLRVSEKRGWFNRNTGHNPFTREGKKTASFEICEHLGWRAPDQVLVCTGDGNIISGIWKGFRDLHHIGLIDRLPKITAVQAEGSAAISHAIHQFQTAGTAPRAHAWKDLVIQPVHARTLADSISVDKPRDGIAGVRSVIESGGQAVTVTDEQILEGLRLCGQLSGVFAEPSAAASIAALKKMAQAGSIHEDEHVVCLISGSGLKDVDAARKSVGDPIVVAPHLEAAEEALRHQGL